MPPATLMDIAVVIIMTSRLNYLSLDNRYTCLAVTETCCEHFTFYKPTKGKNQYVFVTSAFVVGVLLYQKLFLNVYIKVFLIRVWFLNS